MTESKPVRKKKGFGAWARKRVREGVGDLHRVLNGPNFVGKRLGLKLMIDLDSTIDKHILAFGSYEPAQMQTLFSAAIAGHKAAEKSLFLDVGANWGVYALTASTHGIFDRIVAVEADPRNAAQMHANLFLNRLSDKIEVVCAGASDSSAPIEFAMAPQRSRDVSQAGPGEDRPGWTKKVIPAVRVDDLSDMKDGFVVAKIDVEGFEDKALDGMATLLANNRCYLQIEVFDDNLDNITRKMAGLGFTKVAEVGNDRYFKNY